MNTLLAKLLQAAQAMPTTLPERTRADALVTLLFFKIVSDYWQAESQALAKAGRSADEIAQSLRAHAPVIMNEHCLFSVCVEANPAQTATAIRNALAQLETLQPDGRLNQVLNPCRSTLIQNQVDDCGVTKNLAQVVGILNSLRFSKLAPSTLPVFAPSLALAGVFARAMVNLYCGPSRAMRDAGVLMAALLKPRADETVFDPACELGHLLLACAEDLQLRTPGATLRLCGVEAAQDKWAMAIMLMLLSGSKHSHVVQGDILNAPSCQRIGQAGMLADVVITALPEMRAPWNHALAFEERQPRFPRRPPNDNRIALIYHALSCMKPDTGRMAVLVARHVMVGNEGFSLAHYLVENNLIDAVIELPPVSRASQVPSPPLPWCLILRRARCDSAIAFISRMVDEPTGQSYQAGDVVNAYEAFQRRSAHACLMRIDTSVVAEHQYEFDIHQYLAPVTSGYMAMPAAQQGTG